MKVIKSNLKNLGGATSNFSLHHPITWAYKFGIERRPGQNMTPHADASVAVNGPVLNESEGRFPAIKIFVAFLRLGITAFGGPAMVAYIRELAVTKNRWLSEQSFTDGTALCQSIPGATAMQTAAYAGLRAGGPLGALAAFVGFGLPAFILMTVLSAAYQASRDLHPVLAAFHGLHAIVIAIVANAALTFGKSTLKNWRDVILAVAAAAYLIFHGSPIITIVVLAAIALFLYRGYDLKAKPGRSAASNAGKRSLRFAAVLALLLIAGLAVLFVLNRRLFDLAGLMIKVDLFAFGGGFASVPLMLHEVVDVRHWLDSRAFMDGIALGQVTPGPIVITATFVGFEVAGVLGALVGTVAIFAPSFLMVLTTVPYLDRLQGSLPFRRALRGVLASFVGLLGAVTVSFGTAISWSVPMVLIVCGAFVALRLKVDILWVVLVGAVISTLVL
jgi:chromate transporter